MEVIVERPAVLDVHKAQVTACVRVPGPGRERVQEVVQFQTTVRGLLTLRDWLKAHRVTQVAMEATGVYWKPIILRCRRKSSPRVSGVSIASGMGVTAFSTHVSRFRARREKVPDCALAVH